MKSVILNHLYVAVTASISLLVVPCAVLFVTNSSEFIIPLFELSVFLLKVGVVFFAVILAMIILAGKQIICWLSIRFFFSFLSVPFNFIC